MKAIEILRKIDACEESCKWVGEKAPQEAWDTCQRGDWMLTYYAKKYPENKRQLTLAKGHCANTVRHLMIDERSLAAVDAAIAYGNGLLSDDELRNAAENAHAAIKCSDIYVAAYAAFDASYVDYTKYSYESDDGAAYARLKNLLETAGICRKYLHL